MWCCYRILHPGESRPLTPGEVLKDAAESLFKGLQEEIDSSRVSYTVWGDRSDNPIELPFIPIDWDALLAPFRDPRRGGGGGEMLEP